METFQAVVAMVAVLVGSFFSLVGVLGLVRFPDVYTRLHAAGKVGVFSVVLLLIATAVWTPLGWGKALLLILLLMISAPVTSHAIASAAYRVGIPMKQAVRDDLAAARRHRDQI